MRKAQIPAGLSIAQLAARTGLPPGTIRYYERSGLLPAPARTTGDHRRYNEAAADRLQFILGAKRLGLRLADISALLLLRDTGQCPCEPAASLLAAARRDRRRDRPPDRPARPARRHPKPRLSRPRPRHLDAREQVPRRHCGRRDQRVLRNGSADRREVKTRCEPMLRRP